MWKRHSVAPSAWNKRPERLYTKHGLFNPFLLDKCTYRGEGQVQEAQAVSEKWILGSQDPCLLPAPGSGRAE